MKSAIIYASHHHGNTEKIVKYLAQQHEIDLICAEQIVTSDMLSYDLIGFASGIDFGKMYPCVTEAAKNVPTGKKIYALYTCAKDQQRYGTEIEEIAVRNGCVYLGKFGCKGYNTYGPLKIIGGMNRLHPDIDDFAAANAFYEKLINIV